MFGETVRVRIEVAQGGRVKRRPTGVVELLSPLPCPFDYGSIIGLAGPDGEDADAVVLGPPRRAGDDVAVLVRGVVRFLDAGVVDDKWVCGTVPTAADKLRIVRFFTRWGWLKRLRHPRARSGVIAVQWA